MTARLLIVLFMVVIPGGAANAELRGLPLYGKNFFKSCWCKKQRQCHRDFKDTTSYVDKRRGDEYQCLNCEPEQINKPQSKGPLALQIQNIIRGPTNSCRY